MKRSRFKNLISKYLSLFMILSLVIAGMSYAPCAKPITAQAANRKVGGHRVVQPPKFIDMGEVDAEEGKRLHKEALAGSIQKLGQYGQLLTGAEPEYYRLIVGAVEKYAPYNTSYDDALNNDSYSYTLQISKATFDEFKTYDDDASHFQHVIEAAIYDHIDKVQFVLCGISEPYLYQSQGAYYVKIAAVAEDPGNFAAMNQKLVNARSRLISSIPELRSTTSPVEREALIHDAIIDNVSYFYQTASVSSYHTCYTAYGALVEGSAVCDGYAQAFAYVLEALGIDAFVVTGGAGDTEGEASQPGQGHAWNMVKFGSGATSWYEVDLTWDDADDDNDIASRHTNFNLTTDEMEDGYVNPLTGKTEAKGHWRISPFIGEKLDDRAQGTEYNFLTLYPTHSDWFTYDRPVSIKTSINSTSMFIGDSVTATATLTPSNVRNTFVKWLTSDPLVADVDNGVITGIAAGTATITAVSGSNMGATAQIQVTVHTPVTGLTLNAADVNLKVGEAIQLTQDAVPAADDNAACTRSSSDPAVATVENGLVTAISSGAATITATSTVNPAVSATCKISVSKESGSSISIGKGKKSYDYKVIGGEGNAVTFKGTGNKKSKTVKIPAYVTDENGVTYTVQEIAKGALKGRSSLKSVTIPKTVVVIRKNAFKGCSKLNKITINAESLKTVESGAFSGISDKAKITIKVSSKSKYNKLVRKIKKAGAKKATFKWKKG